MVAGVVQSAPVAEQRLQSVAVLQVQHVGCYVRNDPEVPVQRILRTLLRMKMSGEIDDIIGLYIGSKSEANPDPGPFHP
jgi:polar amino acid transport system substrate-binding protein